MKMSYQINTYCDGKYDVKNQPFDDFGSMQTLLRIQVSRRFINEVNVCWFPQTQNQGNTLELSTG